MFIPGSKYKAHKRRQQGVQRSLAQFARSARRAYSPAPTRSGYRYRMQTRQYLRTRGARYIRR